MKNPEVLAPNVTQNTPSAHRWSGQKQKLPDQWKFSFGRICVSFGRMWPMY